MSDMGQEAVGAKSAAKMPVLDALKTYPKEIALAAGSLPIRSKAGRRVARKTPSDSDKRPFRATRGEAHSKNRGHLGSESYSAA